MDWERDGITRRSALTRGFGGVALVCSFDFDKRARPTRRAHERVRARARRPAPFEPVPARPADPAGGAAGRATEQLEQYVFTMKPGTADILPGLQDADPGLRRAASRGRRSRPRGAARSRSASINQSGRELNVHLHGGVTPTAVRRASARRDPERHRAALQVPERRSARRRSGTTTTRTARRPRRCSPGLAGVLPARRSRRRPTLELPQRRLRRPADDPGPQLQRRRLVPLPARPRPRLPRRHDPGQRRGRAADEGRAAAVPAAVPQRLQRARRTRCRSATAARWSRSAPTAACCPAGQAHRRSRSSRPSAST